MPKRAVTISKHTFGEDLTDEQIDYWQGLGHAAIFKAVHELSLLGYLMQGVDARSVPMQRTHFERRVVPWLLGGLDDDA
jgi:hypothetical protein